MMSFDRLTLNKYTGGDRIYAQKISFDDETSFNEIIYDEDHNPISKHSLSSSPRIKIIYSTTDRIHPIKILEKREDSVDKDEHFPSLSDSRKIILKKKDRKNYIVDDIALEIMNGNIRDISQIPEDSVDKWGNLIRKRDEEMRINAEKRKKEEMRINAEKRKKEEEIAVLLKKEEDTSKILQKKKNDLSGVVNDQERELIRLQDEIATIRREINKAGKKSGPWIVKVDPTINYDEPKTIGAISGSFWSFVTCGCGCSANDYDPHAQVFIENSYKKFISNTGPKTVTVTTKDSYGPVTHILNFMDMTYSVGVSVMKLTKTTDRSVQIPNPKYNGPRPIHEIFQMRSYEDQFESSFKKTSLDSESIEYKMVENNFLNDTCGAYQTIKSVGVRVLDVIKVVNPVSARFYELMKDVVDNKTEVMVYHGTRGTNIDTVAKEGLDSRVGAGGYYGKAIYGSDSAFYSYNGYGHKINGSTQEGMMLYVKFLVGKAKETPFHEQNLTKSPQGFDSVRSTTHGEEGIRTVYDNARSYIEYIVHYTTRPLVTSPTSTWW